MILDGGQATELERLGCDLNHHLWSAKLLLEDHEKIKIVHRLYLEAGADCISTATYQASFPGFRKMGLAEAEIEKLFSLSVKIACETRNRFWKTAYLDDVNRPRPLVAGSIGSYGAFLADGSEYTGNYPVSHTELYDFHFKRMKAIMNETDSSHHRVDVFAFETIPSFTEAKILTEILSGFPKMQAWLSFSLRNEKFISEGDQIKEAAAYFEGNKQISAIGVNCTKPEYIPDVIGEIQSGSSKPVIVYPNSGEKYDADYKKWSGRKDTNDDYYINAENWYARGAKIIGGCCRTTPDDIKEVSRFRNDLFKSTNKI